jgi:uncharacterized protein (UPF0335 family)
MNDVVMLNRDPDDGAAGKGEKLEKTSTRTVGTTADRLKSFVERIERLEEEKQGIADGIKEIYGEAKGEGFDAKVLRKVVAVRKKDPQERAEEDELLELYLSAIGD